MEIFAKYILPVLGLLIMLGVPFVYVILTGRYIRGVFRTWFLIVAWYFLLLILNPLFIPFDEELIDGPELFAAALIGWVWGIIISGLGMLVRGLISKFKPSLIRAKDKEVAKEEIGPKVRK